MVRLLKHKDTAQVFKLDLQFTKLFRFTNFGIKIAASLD
ncbi:hypothetical protein PLUTE_a2327 [Pseudoalteromonas luteoviolacea DSM 6061]|nr:hypothetical protein [Pseudoalteromonas luteoviolacea DSM 6061]